MPLIRSALALIATAIVTAACSNSTSAPPVATVPFRFTESVGQFYRDYTGPQRPALNAIGADGGFVAAANRIVLDAQMAGPVLNGGPNFYVWGFDRGGATNAPFPDEPRVKFNAVVVVTADPASGTPTGIVNLLNGSPAVPVTSVVLLAPDIIEVTLDASLLPSTGSAPAQYVWNLWPRSAVGGAATAQIASFIPDNAMASLTAR